MDNERIELLARRVCWLDRYRRRISVGVAIALVPLLVYRLSTLLGVDWPQFHIILLAMVGSGILWWVTEVGLAWVVAVWETEHDRIVRDKGLPRAQLLRSKKSAEK